MFACCETVVKHLTITMIMVTSLQGLTLYFIIMWSSYTFVEINCTF